MYKPNVPQATDFISQSQIDFIDNFQTLSNIYGKPPSENENIGDHIPLDHPEEDERGNHKKTTFIEQGSDPTTGVNELGLYSKDNSGTTELYYRRESDGAVNQLTSSGGISVGGLVLRAAVLFDLEGTILEREEVNGDGDTIKVPLAFNVSSVTANQPPVNGRNIRADWTINFTTALPTVNYMWIIQSFNDVNFSILTNRVVQVQPFNSAAYASTVTANSFRAVGFNIASDSTTITPASPVIGRLDRIIFQAYTVA